MVTVTLLSKLFGMYRDILLAAHYGTTHAAIAFETASRLPLILFDLVIGGVITASFIPIYNELLVKKNKEEAMLFANQYVNLIFFITVLISFIGIFLASPLIELLAPGIAPQTKSLAISLSRMMFPMIIFTGFAFSFTGILQSLGEYNIPALISLVSNCALVVYFYTLNTRFGIFGLALAMLIGWLLQAAVQIPKLHSFGYRWRPTLKLKSPYIRRSMTLGAIILVGSWTQPLCVLVNTRFASRLEGGRAITALSYANKIYIVIAGIFSFVATNLLFPYLSKAISGGNLSQARRIGSGALKLLWLVILPLSVGVLILAEPIVKTIYLRGVFTESDALLTAQALRFLAIGMPALAANEIFTKIFYARQRNTLPMICALVSMLCNFLFLAFLTEAMGLKGIALSSSLAISVNAALNYILLYKSGDPLFSLRDLYDILCMLLCAVVMGGVLFFIQPHIQYLGLLPFMLISTLSGVFVYGFLLLLLPISEIMAAKSAFFNKLKR
ncbi:MAG: murein biosynthesis integral membrane protein MurJ [Clostridiales bacterium]|nr:murein biosynthesis integral membrane protein MurJ [Clostridiales bacterium]